MRTEKRKRWPEGQLAQRKNQLAEGNFQSGRRKNELAQRPLRSGACRKAEAVSPKANPPSGRTNPPRATPNRRAPKSGSSEPEGQPAERNLRSGRRKNELAQQPLRIGARRKAEAVSPKANPPRATPKRKAEEPTRRAEARLEAATPSGENHPRRAFAIRRSKPRNEGSTEQCRHTYQYNRKTRL